MSLGLCGSAGSVIRTGSDSYLYMMFGFERRACDTNQVLRFSLQDYRWERVKCVGEKEWGVKGDMKADENGRSRIGLSQTPDGIEIPF